MRKSGKGKIELPKGEVLVYQVEDGRVKLDVRLQDETVWMTQQMMANLFQSSKQNVSHHINSIFEESELQPNATVKKYLRVRQEGTRNVSRLKNPEGGRYFEELLARIRDIRSSEKIFWRKVLDIYATSIDYDPKLELSKLFFKQVQNKMHWAAHGHTAAELIYSRADADRNKMGSCNPDWASTFKEAKVRYDMVDSHSKLKHLVEPCRFLYG